MKRAIDEDHKQNYREAYRQYQSALGYLMLALKCNVLSSTLQALLNPIRNADDLSPLALCG